MPDNPENLDQELADEWKAIQARHMGDGDDDEAEDDAAEDKAAPDDAGRDKNGRFAAKTEDKAEPEADKPDAEAAPASVEAATDAQQPEVAEQAEASPARDLNRPPASWKPAAKAAWDTLPADIRAEVHRRESDWLRGQSQLLPDAELGRSMRTTIEPYRMLIEAEGGTPERAVQHLLQTAAIFRVGTPQQKQQALAQIAQQYGIAMPQAQDAAQDHPAAGQQYRDPRVDEMLQRQHYAEMQQQADARRNDEMQTKKFNGVVQAWESSVDSAGKLLRPYAGNVEGEMTALIPQIAQTNPGLQGEALLQQAYERAIWAHPEIRPLLLQQQQNEIEAKRRTENQSRVKEAKRAASVNVPRKASVPSAHTERRGIDNMDAVITESARELGLLN